VCACCAADLSDRGGRWGTCLRPFAPCERCRRGVERARCSLPSYKAVDNRRWCRQRGVQRLT
jgi:hypothetical protein